MRAGRVGSRIVGPTQLDGSVRKLMSYILPGIRLRQDFWIARSRGFFGRFSSTVRNSRDVAPSRRDDDHTGAIQFIDQSRMWIAR